MGRPWFGRVYLLTCWLATADASVAGPHQRFRVRPANTSALEGTTIVLHCEVAHQTGQIQWAKQGFALGYARQLPGYPRYRILGDPDAGVHDLEVNNVTLEDEGRFQCQVSPHKGQPAIRADAFLSVLLKPRSVQLRAIINGKAVSGVAQVEEDDALSLRCDVTGARPTAAITWRRNGRNLDAEREAVSSGSPDAAPGDTSATLTLRPGRENDGDVISCVAHHPAVPLLDQRLFSASITLSVLYSPGRPVISGYRPGQTLRAGEQRTLTCTSSGGNPRARLRWTKNGRPVSHDYQVTQSGASASYKFIADQTDLHAIYRCQATSQVQLRPLVAQLQTVVQFGPQRVTVTGTETARPGEEAQMTCESSASSPPANVTWSVGGRPLRNFTSSVSAAVEGGWTTVSNIRVQVPKDTENDLQFTCRAQNLAIDHSRSGTATVSVLLAPGAPSIEGWRPEDLLQAGQRVTLSCLVRGGNPRPRLSWHSGGVSLEARPQTSSGDTRSMLTLTVTAGDNGRRLVCRCRSDALPRPVEASATLRVSFPPESVEISVAPERLQAGGEALLTCQSGPSLPEAQLSWWSLGRRLTDQVQSTETFPDGNHGGFATRSVLRRRLRWLDDGAEFICRARVPSFTGTVKKAHTLSVLHAPVIIPPVLNVTAAQGADLSVNLSIRANPAPASAAWSRSDDVIVTSVEGGAMRFRSLQRKDAGWYRVLTKNALGSASARVHIDVLYPPEIVKTVSTLVVSRGEDATLACPAEAHPLAADMFKWSRPGGLMPNSSTGFTNSTSFLTIPRVSPASVGEFECFVENKLGSAKGRFAVVIKEPASIVKSPRFAKAAALHNEVAHLTCRARGAPDVTFQWSRRGVVIGNKTRDVKYRLERKQLDLTTGVSMLRISDVNDDDYGAYACAATNRLGSDSHTVQLVVPSVPDPPRDLRVLNVSSQAATLAWTPGFDGGFIQGFRFRFWRRGSSRPQLQDGDPNSARFTVHRLQPDSSYLFTVAGYSQLGLGPFSKPPVLVTTGGSPPVSYVTDREGSPSARFPAVLVGVASVAGVVLLLLLNAGIISCCYLRRRHLAAARSGGASPESSRMYVNEDSSFTAGGARSVSLDDSLDKGDDCQLLPGVDSSTPSRLFPHIVAAGPNDYLEMAPRTGGVDSAGKREESYGYSHLTTSSTSFYEATCSETPSLDASSRDASFQLRPVLSRASCDLTGGSDDVISGHTVTSPVAPRRRKLVSFDDVVAVCQDSDQDTDRSDRNERRSDAKPSGSENHEGQNTGLE